ncbi:NAD kinase [Promicromonospora umidemergens]|uniref:NAD(+)/NADH kinase n=1 Tax=Promicromonospora umidemergens TaxID=629679 RepID=A0ABP8WPY7_9MICO|nr:hypothetical protein [Promicromonospora umidemergens]MCP2285798.1 NAD kinase [Promicromonospora umidemergens]
MALRTRAVLVHRRTELDELLDRHATRGQAAFFLRTRGRTLADVEARHDAVASARRAVAASVPSSWALAEVERADLDRFLFAPEDVVVVVGQDGLVANAAKYLDRQLVVGVNPEPGTNLGVLVRHDADGAARIIGNLATTVRGAGEAAFAAVRCDELTMVHARLDDGQELRAVNELFLGHPSHQSARYVLAADGESERQSSSGLIVSTGTGATGWSASIAHDRGGRGLPGRTDPALAWFVREAWPSPVTGVSMTEGLLGGDGELVVTVQSDRLVVFGDGMESDRLEVSWGQEVRIGMAERRLRLV